MIDFPFQTYLFVYSLCTTPEFSEEQNKHYLNFFFFSLWKENLTGKSYCCVSCFVWHTFIYPKACLILLLLWKLVISIKVAFLCRGLISVDQSYWLIANSPLPSSIYILGANRLEGETTRGAKRLGGKRPGGKRLGGEMTRGGEWFGGETSRIHKNPYPHDRRADKDSYSHDSNNQCIILRLQLSFVMINVQLMLV